jgi:hypothetical protein
MSTRISSLVALSLLAGCGAPLPDKAAEARNRANAAAIARAEGRVPCAPLGEQRFTHACAIDRVESQDGLFLTLRHADGGFRRLLVTRDGRGVIAADGAEPAVVTPVGAREIDVALGGMRYRLPATVRGAASR